MPDHTEPAKATLTPARAGAVAHRQSLLDRADAFVSRLAARNRFWHRVCSLIWLPYAFRSGITMRRVDERTYTATLPFKRFNRNWYNAMAGAALLGNAEIAGGNYVFALCGGDYVVVCKELSYRFLRPCFGPAIYRITPKEDIQALIAGGGEFNATIDMDIMQAGLVPKPLRSGAEKVLPHSVGDRVTRDRRVGRCTATFHVTPKSHQKARGRSIRP